jgi:Amt family ammonium transporter
MYCRIIIGFVYPAVSHWAWADEGWLKSTEYHDFAGSSVVHITGGAASLIAGYLLGPRADRIDPVTGELQTLRGHSVPVSIFHRMKGVISVSN